MAKSVQFHILNTLSQALTEVFDKEKHADRSIDKYMRVNPKWTPAERGFFAEGVYEIVRHKRNLEFLAESTELWKIIGAYLILHDYKLPLRREFEGLTPDSVKKRATLNRTPAIEHSFPDWLFEIGEKEFGSEWPALMQSLNKPPDIFLRANTLKTNAGKLQTDLKADGIQCVPVKSNAGELPDCVKLKERKNLFITTAFKAGHFEMQDAGSQYVAPLLQVQPGQDVVDACAGAGGKSLHLAALMQNKGKITAMDIHDWKLNDLSGRAARAGVSILQTKLIASPKTIKQLNASFDRVLLDVPCSGLGVLRRNPDCKWKMTAAELDGLVELQKDILTRYSEMCRPGGAMVYATCSILRRENEDQVKAFMISKAGKSWELLAEHRVWPHKHGFDGFYAAVLKRK